MKQKVLFVYNWVPDNLRINEYSESASTATVNYIQETLTAFHMEVVSLNVQNPEQMVQAIKDNAPIDVAFVIAEGFLDEPVSLYDGTGALRVRQILEMYRIPYTHSGVKSMEICRNKDITYQILGTKGINIPKFFVFSDVNQMDNISKAEGVVGYPMFVKPSGGGNSIGIDERSIVSNRKDLIEKLKQLRELTGNQPIIAETYLSGREYTVGIIGNEIPQVMPIIAFPEDFTVRSQQVKKVEYKERERFEFIAPTEQLGLKIREIAIQVFDAIGANDIIRIDLRQDHHGNVFVIDVNGTPSLAYKGSLAYMAERVDITHEGFIGFLLYTTLLRNALPINELLEENALKVMLQLNGNFDNQVA